MQAHDSGAGCRPGSRHGALGVASDSMGATGLLLFVGLPEGMAFPGLSVARPTMVAALAGSCVPVRGVTACMQGDQDVLRDAGGYHGGEIHAAGAVTWQANPMRRIPPAMAVPG